MVQLDAAYWYAKFFTQQLSILGPSCAFVMQLSKCNLCFKHHTYERGHIWSQCTIESYAKLRQHVNIKLRGISGTYVAKQDRLGLSWIMKSTLQFWLNQRTQTLLTSADIGYMCRSVLYISIRQARGMSFSVASLPSWQMKKIRRKEHASPNEAGTCRYTGPTGNWYLQRGPTDPTKSTCKVPTNLCSVQRQFTLHTHAPHSISFHTLKHHTSYWRQ